MGNDPVRHLKYFAFLLFGLCAGLPSAQAQEAHDNVRKGLLHLFGTGTPGLSTHPNFGRADGVETQGTGFFVSADGLILTTRHFLDPLEKAEARQIRITAAIGGASSRRIPLLVASDLPSVDLLLLKANMPFDMDPPEPLKIGRTSNFDRSNPTPLFTSGFHDKNYRKLEASFNDAQSDDVAYAWTLNVKTNPGQSGSPVYDAEGTVLGIIKATARSDDELTLMIPVDFAMPLIGHLEIDRLNRQIKLLTSILGEMTQNDPPLNKRLNAIEENLSELGQHFTWTATTLPDGSIAVQYEKLIGGGTQINEIRVQLKPIMRFRENGRTVTRAQRPLKLGSGENNEFTRLDDNGDARIGKFLVPDVFAKLKNLTETFSDVSPDEPFPNLELTVVPVVDDTELDPRKFNLTPNFTVDLTQ